MAYTKITDFAAKDALLTGTPAKVVKGTEIGAEFDAIETEDALNVKTTALGTGVETFLGTPSSANLAAAVTGETGTGALVFGTGPTLSAPVLGTPASGTLTSCTGLPISTGVSGLGTGVATALAINIGSAGASVVLNGALGTPSSGTLTNATGLPASGVAGTALVAAAIGSTVQAYDATLASLAGLTLTQGALLTATGSDAGAVLAKGTASQQLRMNAGATAPEWFTPSTSSLYIQIVSTDIAAATGTTGIPCDNTTPLVSEGTQVATLNITPADSTNLVEVNAAFTFAPGLDLGTSTYCIGAAALFRGSTCISVQRIVGNPSAPDIANTIAFHLVDGPTSSSAVTYSIRVGYDTSSGTAAGWNCANSGLFSGAGDENQLILKEIAA